MRQSQESSSNLRPHRLQSYRRGTVCACGSLAALLSLSACLLTSPYHNQEFAQTSDQIPLTAWSEKDSSVKFECATAYHGGLYPPFEDKTWVPIATVSASGAIYDPQKGRMYSYSTKQTLPVACWREDPGNGNWYSAIRARLDGKTVHFSTFTNPGLECLGRETGKAASWVGWIGKNCVATYSGSTTELGWARIYVEG